jgi:hypothetical protein
MLLDRSPSQSLAGAQKIYAPQLPESVQVFLSLRETSTSHWESNQANRVDGYGMQRKAYSSSQSVKSVEDTLRMEYDQRVIIKFFLNEGGDARAPADRLQIRLDEHVYELRTVQFWIAEVRLSRQDIHYEIPAGKNLWMILMPKFWLY